MIKEDDVVLSQVLDLLTSQARRYARFALRGLAQAGACHQDVAPEPAFGR